MDEEADDDDDDDESRQPIYRRALWGQHANRPFQGPVAAEAKSEHPPPTAHGTTDGREACPIEVDESDLGSAVVDDVDEDDRDSAAQEKEVQQNVSPPRASLTKRDAPIQSPSRSDTGITDPSLELPAHQPQRPRIDEVNETSGLEKTVFDIVQQSGNGVYKLRDPTSILRRSIVFDGKLVTVIDFFEINDGLRALLPEDRLAEALGVLEGMTTLSIRVITPNGGNFQSPALGVFCHNGEMHTTADPPNLLFELELRLEPLVSCTVRTTLAVNAPRGLPRCLPIAANFDTSVQVDCAPSTTVALSRRAIADIFNQKFYDVYAPTLRQSNEDWLVAKLTYEVKNPEGIAYQAFLISGGYVQNGEVIVYITFLTLLCLFFTGQIGINSPQTSAINAGLLARDREIGELDGKCVAALLLLEAVASACVEGAGANEGAEPESAGTGTLFSKSFADGLMFGGSDSSAHAPKGIMLRAATDFLSKDRELSLPGRHSAIVEALEKVQNLGGLNYDLRAAAVVFSVLATTLFSDKYRRELLLAICKGAPALKPLNIVAECNFSACPQSWHRDIFHAGSFRRFIHEMLRLLDNYRDHPEIFAPHPDDGHEALEACPPVLQPLRALILYTTGTLSPPDKHKPSVLNWRLVDGHGKPWKEQHKPIWAATRSFEIFISTGFKDHAEVAKFLFDMTAKRMLEGAVCRCRRAIARETHDHRKRTPQGAGRTDAGVGLETGTTNPLMVRYSMGCRLLLTK
ncbi:hypothetical protein CTAYLR_008985 [Chrysophaeum taylorii]|uniref:Uncharacterized protein n=1 Tax=Chrysophaeum taylorii TaxID=2483200 RepID=A0AAD7XJE1_9STRA|nr:hypothetical protein CTAYLR_008985 [Chrysophaeum taylorii]